MKKETIINIACYILAIGVIIGLVLYKSNHKQSHYVQPTQSYSSTTKPKSMSSGSKTKDKIDEIYREFSRLKESPALDQSRLAMIKFRQSRDTLLYWIGVREEELEECMREAENKGDNVVLERCEQELDNLSRKREEAASAR